MFGAFAFGWAYPGDAFADISQARLSQEVVEGLYSTSNAKARVSQEAVEALWVNNAATARVSQVVTEALFTYPANAKDRLSQIVVEALTTPPRVNLGFIASRTAVYTPTLTTTITGFPFIASRTVVYAPIIQHLEIDLPFITSRTRAYGIFSLFTDFLGTGPGNGGEYFPLRLNAAGATETATLDVSITTTSSVLHLTGDSGLPTSEPFIVRIDGEEMYVLSVGGGAYRIRRRALGNTSVAGHTAGANVTWDDSYDQAIVASADILASFAANITGSGLTTYPGWLICFDSSQGYLSGLRYPMHVAQLLGVFDAGAGLGGTNRCDAAQPNAIATTAAASDECPAALSNPSRVSTDILAGDVAVVRYTNPEGSPLDLGPRSVAIQSWFGLKRVSNVDVDVTLTDPNGHVVDTNPGVGPYTGSVNGEWDNPLGPGIGFDTGTPTPNDVPYTSVTLPGTDRYFTDAIHYEERGWPMCALAVRQGRRRIPLWRSWDWHNFDYVFDGFFTDATFVQMLINRNGIVFGSVPEVDLPGPQDIDGPDAVWDDGSYQFGASWYVVIFGTPYLVAGPGIGGVVPVLPPGGPGGPVPVVTFGPGGTATVTSPSPGTVFVEGGFGGDINPPGGDLHVWQYFS